jgi:outer membrane protein insertion porin family
MEAIAAVEAPVPEIEYGLTRKTYEIAGIEVEGADSYEDFVLIGFSGLAVGDKIEVPGEQITKAIRRFWKQGLFSNVKIRAKQILGSKIWLVIELQQRPRVSEVRYEGLKKSEKEDVEVKTGIRQGSQMTPNLEDHAKTVIKKYLAEKGFHNAEVTVIQRNDPDHPGYVRVLVGVDKKSKTKVGKIYITGNEALSDLQINKAMKKTNDNHIINLLHPFSYCFRI